MSTSRDSPNPLRPYAVPPSIGPSPVDIPRNASTSAPRSPGYGSTRPAAPHPSKRGYSSAARDMLSELDYADYMGDAAPSITEVIKNLMDQGLWKYTSVLMAQPFEVAKTVLQVQDAGAVGAPGKKGKAGLRRRASYGRESYDLLSDDSDNDSQSYFTSAAPNTPKISSSGRRRYASSRSQSPPTPRSSRHGTTSPGAEAAHTHNLPSTSSVTAALSSLWTHEGAWGVWKGTNSTFIHSVLLNTITAFLRSLLCAVLALPDPGLSAAVPALAGPSTLVALDIVSSPAPFLSLLVSVTASGIAGLILAPIDIARTRLMLTPNTHQPRSVVAALRELGSWVLPAAIAPVTLLHSALPTLISTATPLVLRANLGIDPILTPSTYAVATFASQAFELGLRLPIETVLRRGQLHIIRARSPPYSSHSSHHSTLSSPPPHSSPSGRLPFVSVVDVGTYKGLFGTMYHIVFEEGSRSAKGKTATKQELALAPVDHGPMKKGQGLEGLWRGWRVGIWGLVGCWGAATLGGGSGRGGEF